jgi:DNA-directed RNA polymerase specialized sigma24 family protein
MSQDLKKYTFNTKRMKQFNQLKGCHMDFFSSTLWRLTGNREMFREAMKDALFAIWQKPNQFGRKASCNTLYSVVLAANARVWQRETAINADESDCRDVIPYDINRERFGYKVRWAISHLEPQHAMAVILRYFERKDYGSIAQAMGCTWGVAKTLVSGGVRTLKNLLRQVTGSPSEAIHIHGAKPLALPA